MANYKKMYFELFNAVTDAIQALQRAQQQAEAMYMRESDSDHTQCKNNAQLHIHHINNSPKEN